MLKLDKKRFRVKYCPCGKSNKDGKFVPFVGHADKGYCHACGEKFLPAPSEPKLYIPLNSRKKQADAVSYIDKKVFEGSLKGYESNHLVKFLTDKLGIDPVIEMLKKYNIGTSCHWPGATVFWQMDIEGRVRAGKIMLYSLTTGKRVKEPYNHVTWAHTALKQPRFALKQCFFGEHLLTDKFKPVAIVESEKTAVIASIYLPQFLWLATGSLTSLTAEKCRVLKSRNVILFPDLNGYENWKRKAAELSSLASFTVSDLLERKATEAERMQGLDMADYLLRFDLRDFQPKQVSKAHSQQEAEEPVSERKFWHEEIEALENYFLRLPLPSDPVRLRQHITITSAEQFVKSHLATVKTNNGNRTFLPYLNRLNQLKAFLSENFA